MSNLSPEVVVATVVKVGETLIKNDDFKSFVFGNYSDGTPRKNLPDAINGEKYSPEQKKRLEKRIKEREKERRKSLKKKSKKKKKNKKKDKVYRKDWGH